MTVSATTFSEQITDKLTDNFLTLQLFNGLSTQEKTVKILAAMDRERNKNPSKPLHFPLDIGKLP